MTSPKETPTLTPSTYETLHVHSIYEQIAPHFSSTRYKPWPIVTSFLLSLPPGSIGLDIGCGNGKYLSINPSIFIIGSDYSASLSKIASKNTAATTTTSNENSNKSNNNNNETNAVIVADTLHLPHQKGRFDFAISIAVVHHFSTEQRRREALGCILECLKIGSGRALVYCWALEQKGSRRGWEEGGEQDVMVPWVMKSSSSGGKERRKEGSLKKRGKNKNGFKDGKEGENKLWKREGEEEKVGDDEDSTTKNQGGTENLKGETEQTFQRYYHLYRKGELEEDIISVGGEIMERGYEKDNWWAICRRPE